MSIVDSFKEDFYELKSNIRFEFLKNFRQRRLRIVIVISAVLGLLFYVIPLMSGSDFPDEAADFISNNLGFVNLIIVLNAMFLGSDAINREYESKTALLVFPLPQRSTIVIVAKYATQLISSWSSIFVYYGVTAFSVTMIYGFDAIPSEMKRSILFAMLYMAALLAVAFFISALLNSPAASMTLTFFGIFLLLPIINMVLGIIDVNTDWIPTNYSGFITSVFRFPTVEGFGPGGDGSGDLDFYDGIVYLLIYTMVGLLAAIGLALNKEVK